jgi:hypothetical protein
MINRQESDHVAKENKNKKKKTSEMASRFNANTVKKINNKR